MAVPLPPVLRALVALCVHLLAGVCYAQSRPTAGQLSLDVSFDSYTPYSNSPELVRRLLSPAAAVRLGKQLTQAGTTLTGQPVNLAAERFIVYVPAQKPEQGFGLLVFVPPWDQARLPARWAQALDQRGVIFVSAARSGNDENPMGRREPLALLAAHNIQSRYPVDPRHVYIAGFSGGSRVALRLALGYPDLFRGAILNAGSDVIGSSAAEPPIPLPPRELLYQFQESSHIVYVTGERDSEHIADDLLSARSMHEWCMYSTDAIVVPRGEHEIADAANLSRALDRLLDARLPDAHRLARCRADIETEMDAAFRKVESFIAGGDRTSVDKLLERIDRQFGGLAAPRSLELLQPR